MGDQTLSTSDDTIAIYSDAQIYVTKLPGRKRHALIMERKNRMYPLAWFTSDEAVDVFMAAKPHTTPMHAIEEFDRVWPS